MAAPAATVKLFTDIAANRGCFSKLTVRGYAAAKVTGAVKAEKLRIIMPLPAILSTIDALLANALRPHIDRFCQSIDPAFLETAVRGRQISDLTFALRMIIERGGDLHGASAIGQ